MTELLEIPFRFENEQIVLSRRIENVSIIPLVT